MKEKERDINRTAFLVAIAAVLQITESMLPHPVPGLRLGLGNIITVVALVDISFRAALEIALLRVTVSSLVLGTFLAPPFLLSMSGALMSTLAMGAVFRFVRKKGRPLLSVVGISLIGAAMHNLAQISTAYLLVIRTAGVFLFLPWLGVGAAAGGWITGLVSRGVLKNLSGREASIESARRRPLETAVPAGFSSGNMPGVYAKIAAAFIAGGYIIISSDIRGLFTVLIFSLLAGFVLKAGILKLFLKLKNALWIIVASFLLGVLFTSGGEIFFRVESLNITITRPGVMKGSVIALRITALLSITGILSLSTSYKDLVNGIKSFLYPLKIVGISPGRLAGITVASWEQIPRIQKDVKNFMKNRKGKKNRLKNLLPAVSGFIAELYKRQEI